MPFSEDQVILGTDYGLWYGYKNNGGKWIWERYSDDEHVDWAIGSNNKHSNLPQGRVADIEYVQEDNKVIVSIFGRGLWESHIPCSEITPDATVGNATWNGFHRRVDHDIIVQSGATFTITNCELAFGPQRRIIVEDGATLMVNGSTLTNSCEEEWAESY